MVSIIFSAVHLVPSRETLCQVILIPSINVNVTLESAGVRSVGRTGRFLVRDITLKLHDISTSNCVGRWISFSKNAVQKNRSSVLHNVGVTAICLFYEKWLFISTIGKVSYNIFSVI